MKEDAGPPVLESSWHELPMTNYRVFYGRERELEVLQGSCAGGAIRLVSIISMGGAGKTALINRWLHEVRSGRTPRRVCAWSFAGQGGAVAGQVSSEKFLGQALASFGVATRLPPSPFEKARLLADHVQRRNAILVLDGLEPLQEPPGSGAPTGRLRDQGLLELLVTIARGTRGFCVISSRLVIPDLSDVPSHRSVLLDSLSERAGARLLRALLANDASAKQRAVVDATPEAELRRASREFHGHPLSLRLLAQYVSTRHSGDIRRRDTLEHASLGEAGEDATRRIMSSYADWFRGKPELEILHLLGLFDRFATGQELRALRAPPAIPGLTERLQDVSETEWNGLLSALRHAKLVDPTLSPREEEIIECHPLIREYFRGQLQALHPEAWRDAHFRLYQHFSSSLAKEYPETPTEAEPLIRAISHGCRAGRHSEVFEEVYCRRLSHGDDFQIKRLGAIGSVRSAVSSFFIRLCFQDECNHAMLPAWQDLYALT